MMKMKIKAGIIGIAALLGIGCSLHPGQVGVKALLSDLGAIRISVPALSARHTQSRYEDIDHIDFTLESVQKAADGAVSTVISTRSLTFDEQTPCGPSPSVNFPNLWPGVATISATVYGDNPLRLQSLHTQGQIVEISTATASATASVTAGQTNDVTLNIKLEDTLTQSGNLTISLGVQDGNEVLQPILYRVSTFAGEIQGYLDGQDTAAQFDWLTGITVDSSGNLFVADANSITSKAYVRKIAPDRTVSTYASNDALRPQGEILDSPLFNPSGLALDSNNNVFVSSTGNPVITKITPAKDVSTVLDTEDGASACFYGGQSCLACDSNGNLYVADSINHQILKIAAVGGAVSRIAGFAGAGGGVSGFTDGALAESRFNTPAGLAFDARGDLYVADSVNNAIRKISGGMVSTFAGTGGSGYKDGPGNAATFNEPWGLAFDHEGNLFVAERSGNRIRKITPAGVVSTIAGTGAPGSDDGSGRNATFDSPTGIVVGSDGALYVTESNNHRIRMLEQRILK